MRMECVFGSSRWKAKLCIGHVIFGSKQKEKGDESFF